MNTKQAGRQQDTQSGENQRWAAALPAFVEDAKQRSLPPFDELIIGFVRAIGTNLDPLVETVSSILYEAEYEIVDIHVSDLVENLPNFELRDEDASKSQGAYRYYKSRMDECDQAREEYGNGDLLARLTVEGIAKQRMEHIARRNEEDPTKNVPTRLAYLVRSLMHPAELALLRHVYGPHFISVAVYQSESQRWEQLKGRMIRSTQSEGRSAEDLARELLERDRGSHASRTKLSVEKTFHLCDVFVDVADPSSPRMRQDRESRGLTERTIDRLFDQVFSRRNGALSRHESAMANAYVAATRSTSLSRRVGAALTTRDGDLVSVGWNEVPAIGGGQYPVYDSVTDTRVDHSDPYFVPPEEIGIRELNPGYGYDANDLIKYELVRDLLERLGRANSGLDNGSAARVADGQGHEDSVDDQMAALLQSDEIRKARIFDVIEFGRAVHAEMSALLSAAAKGIAPSGMYLYCTTFPCHECARHIIAAGISRVVYVEPYPKSRVFDLHSDAASLGQQPDAHVEVGLRKTEFLPFIGISPSRQSDLFSWIPRKPDFGEKLPPGESYDGIVPGKIGSAPLRWSQVEHQKLAEQISQLARQAAERLVVYDLASEKRAKSSPQ